MPIRLPEFLPGPMEGVALPPLVEAWASMKAFDFYLTPFLRISTGVPGKKVLNNFLDKQYFSREHVIVQLMGIDAEKLALAARAVRLLGAGGVNFNFACPSRQVISSGAGGEALRNIPFMCEVLKETMALNPDFPVSVKIRCGRTDFAETEKIIPALLEASGGKLDFMAVHFRTVAEKYYPLPFETALKRLKRAVELTSGSGTKVFVNGDLDMVQKMRQAQDYTGAYGVMSARGLLKDPLLGKRFLAGENGDNLPSPEEARQQVWQFLSGRKLSRGWVIGIAGAIGGDSNSDNAGDDASVADGYEKNLAEKLKQQRGNYIIL